MVEDSLMGIVLLYIKDMSPMGRRLLKVCLSVIIDQQTEIDELKEAQKKKEK